MTRRAVFAFPRLCGLVSMCRLASTQCLSLEPWPFALSLPVYLYTLVSLCIGHSAFVTALAAAPPGTIASLPQGALVSGSQDKSVMVWDPDAGNAAGPFTPITPLTHPDVAPNAPLIHP